MYVGQSHRLKVMKDGRAGSETSDHMQSVFMEKKSSQMAAVGMGQVAAKGLRTESIVWNRALELWEFLEMMMAKYFALAAFTVC